MRYHCNKCQADICTSCAQGMSSTTSVNDRPSQLRVMGKIASDPALPPLPLARTTGSISPSGSSTTTAGRHGVPNLPLSRTGSFSPRSATPAVASRHGGLSPRSPCTHPRSPRSVSPAYLRRSGQDRVLKQDKGFLLPSSLQSVHGTKDRNISPRNLPARSQTPKFQDAHSQQLAPQTTPARAAPLQKDVPAFICSSPRQSVHGQQDVRSATPPRGRAASRMASPHSDMPVRTFGFQQDFHNQLVTRSSTPARDRSSSRRISSFQGSRRKRVTFAPTADWIFLDDELWKETARKAVPIRPDGQSKKWKTQRAEQWHTCPAPMRAGSPHPRLCMATEPSYGRPSSAQVLDVPPQMLQHMQIGMPPMLPSTRPSLVHFQGAGQDHRIAQVAPVATPPRYSTPPRHCEPRLQMAPPSLPPPCWSHPAQPVWAC